MSKHALEAYSDSLRRELMPWDLHVSIVEPGVIATPIWEKAKDTARERRHLMSEEAATRYGAGIDAVEERINSALEHALSPEEVARVVYHALTASRPRTRYLVGSDAKWIARFARWFSDRAMDRMLARRRRKS
jgi:NAD(P)-dependent dehydrogenase (short-subunit alcohol dehydrogenase family)